MARNKNALRKHYVQPYVEGSEPSKEEWLHLAKYITDIGVEPNEETEEYADYAGDGTPKEDVVSVARAYTPEGQYDPEDEAQELIAEMQDKIGDGRLLWHRVVRADGKKEWVGVATALDIVAGAGPASDFEEFSCTLRFNEIPEATDITPGG